MARLLVIRLFVTVLVVGVWFVELASYDDQGTFAHGHVAVAGHPYLSRIVPDENYLIPLPAGLEEGDLVDRRTMSVAERETWAYPIRRPGDRLHLTVIRGGELHRVSLTAVEVPGDRVFAFLIGTHGVYAAMGLMLLWRGRDWGAWGLATWAFGFTLKEMLVLPGMPHLLGSVLDVVLRVVRDVGLFVAALSLVGAALPARARSASTWAMAALVTTTALARAVYYLGYTIWGWVPAWLPAVAFQSINLALVICVLVLAIGYVRAEAGQRLRIRWVLAACLFLLLTYLFWPATYPGPMQRVVLVFLTLATAGCFLYGILRHHLVDLSFVASRTLVYATVLALVVGTFAIVEHAIAAKALGKGAGLALHLLVPLVLGIVLHRVLGRVEHLIERLFFRRQFAADRALQRLADESAYMETGDALVARTLEDVAAHAGSQRVALYLRQEDGYACAGQRGGPEWPLQVDADDRLFVALRASPVERGLSESSGALKGRGIAFPMPVAGRLHGVLVCGERAERFTRDECATLRRVAQHVGIALHALKAREDAALLDQLVHGAVPLDVVRQQRRAAASLRPADADWPRVAKGDPGVRGIPESSS
jgi:hypothetical protein